MIITSDLYKRAEDCCGCEVCAASCPKGIIEMKPSSDGFMYPVAIAPDKCIDCNLCIKVCPVKNPFTGQKAVSHFGGYSKSENDIRKSASGAMASIISKAFIEKDGVVYGVKYSDDFLTSEYTRCSSLKDIDALRGSKYSQSRKHNIFHKIKNDLKFDRRVLFIGLPCEVQALKLFLRVNYTNLYTAALICHGPTSPTVQTEYITNITNKVGSKVKEFTLRDKPKGWKPYFIKATFDDGSIFQEEFHPSVYGIAFKELKRQSCAVCKFKLNYHESHINADIIIGDFHGATPSDPQSKLGVSQSSVLTSKGEELISMSLDQLTLSTITPHKAIHYNRALYSTIKPRWNRNQFAKTMAKDGLLAACQLRSITLIDQYEALVGYIKHILVKVKRFIK